MIPMAILPIHETLDALVASGAQHDWCSCNADQQGFKDSMAERANKLDLEMKGWWCGLAIWGDAAPYSKKDSI